MSGTVNPDSEIFVGGLPVFASAAGLRLLAYDATGAISGLEPAAVGSGEGGGTGGEGGAQLSDAAPLSDASSGSAGTSPLASRADHRHPFPTATQVGAAASVHTHSILEITSLQIILDGKAQSVHTHTISQVSNLQPILDNKAPLAHTHPMSDVANLTATLAAKQDTSARGAANGYAPLDEQGLIPPMYLPAGTGTGGGTGGTGGTGNIDNGTITGQIAVWNNEKGRGEWKAPIPVTADRTRTVERNSATTLSFLEYNRSIVCLTNVAPLTVPASEVGTAPNQGMKFAVSNRHTAINNLTFGAGIAVDAYPAGTGTGGTVKVAAKGFVTVVIHPEGSGLTAIVRGQIV